VSANLVHEELRLQRFNRAPDELSSPPFGYALQESGQFNSHWASIVCAEAILPSGETQADRLQIAVDEEEEKRESPLAETSATN